MNKSVKDRKELVNKSHSLSIARQCELIEVSRSSFYYEPKTERAFNLELMRLIDEQYLKHPWLGVPRMTAWLREDQNILVNHKRVERLYRLMGLSAIAPKPNTSKKGKGVEHKVFPYLLKGLKIERPNQVWAMDITYIPVKGGYLYLCAVIDLYSRFVVNWSLSNTMTADWCKQSLQGAMEQYGVPEILNTDQGSQFTANAFTDWVTAPEQGIKHSMDGKGRAIDNIFIERLWRTLKYEHVYLFPSDDGLACYKGLNQYFRYYNQERRHQSLGNQTPQTIYEQTKKKAA